MRLDIGSQTVGRAEFRVAVGDLRPELHRYCARLMGSVIEGEDVVQDALAKALTAFDDGEAPQMFRAWLFRVAHNRALDLLRSRAIRTAEPLADAAQQIPSDAPDPLEAMMRQDAVNTAVSRFVELPVVQRSAVILKDVLGHSLEEIAALLETTVDSVKAHLARGRAGLKRINAAPPPVLHRQPPSAAVVRYVDLFNRRDWDGLRAMLADDVRLRQATHPARSGAADVGMFFSVYDRSAPVRLMLATLQDREVILVFEEPDAPPSYLMWLEWQDGQISVIQDYRYARYVLDGAELVVADNSSQSPA